MNVEANTHLKRKRSQFEYNGSVNHHLLCCICTEAFEDPVQHKDAANKCKNVYCRSCIQEFKANQLKKELTFRCPKCMENILNCMTEIVDAALPLKNMVDETEVTCKVCSKVLQRGDLSNHWEKYCQAACPFKCGLSFIGRIALEEHSQNKCPNSPIHCLGKNFTQCMWIGSRLEYRTHQATCLGAKLSSAYQQFSDLMIQFEQSRNNNKQKDSNEMNNNNIVNSSSVSANSFMHDTTTLAIRLDSNHTQVRRDWSTGEEVDVWYRSNESWRRSRITDEVDESDLVVEPNDKSHQRVGISRFSHQIAVAGTFTEPIKGRMYWEIGTLLYVYFAGNWFPGQLIAKDDTYLRETRYYPPWKVRVLNQTINIDPLSTTVEFRAPATGLHFVASAVERQLGWDQGVQVDVLFQDSYIWEKGIIDCVEYDEAHLSHLSDLNPPSCRRVVKVRSINEYHRHQWFNLDSDCLAKAGTQRTDIQIKLDDLHSIQQVDFNHESLGWIKANVVLTGPNCLAIELPIVGLLAAIALEPEKKPVHLEANSLVGFDSENDGAHAPVPECARAPVLWLTITDSRLAPLGKHTYKSSPSLDTSNAQPSNVQAAIDLVPPMILSS